MACRLCLEAVAPVVEGGGGGLQVTQSWFENMKSVYWCECHSQTKQTKTQSLDLIKTFDVERNNYFYVIYQIQCVQRRREALGGQSSPIPKIQMPPPFPKGLILQLFSTGRL